MWRYCEKNSDVIWYCESQCGRNSSHMVTHIVRWLWEGCEWRWIPLRSFWTKDDRKNKSMRNPTSSLHLYSFIPELNKISTLEDWPQKQSCFLPFFQCYFINTFTYYKNHTIWIRYACNGYYCISFQNKFTPFCIVLQQYN